MLNRYNIPVDMVLSRYNEPHRFYHNLNHIIDLLEKAKNRGCLSHDLFLAILFHDIIYDPHRTDNEERSADLFYSLIPNEFIKHAILETKDHVPSTRLSSLLCDLDMSGLYSDFDTFMTNTNNIAKEYQYLDWSVYQENRIKFLEKYNVNPIYISAVKRQKPNIAVYPGSFNPFHIGHLNILTKAEKIFDKVIIARGINPDKSGSIEKLPDILLNRQIEIYDGLLTDFVKKLGYDVTVIRGLRNTTDLQYEINQYRFLQDFDPSIKLVSIFCDREFEHISSSAIKTLEKFNKHYNIIS